MTATAQPAPDPRRGAAPTDLERLVSELADRVRALSEQVAELEDRRAITDLMTSYGPAIDSGDATTVAQVWTEDGIYDVDTGVMRGRAEIEAMVTGTRHQGYVQAGCAHILEPADVRIGPAEPDGTRTAVATGKSMLIVANGADGGTDCADGGTGCADGGTDCANGTDEAGRAEAPFTVLRATANRWELVKRDGRWRCRRRVGRVLDGRPEARELLASGAGAE